MLRRVARAEVHGADERGEVAFDEHEAGAVHGDIGAGAHGDADIGGGEGGGVVEAVAGEDDAFAAEPGTWTSSCFVAGVTPAWKPSSRKVFRR
jgi:hypothetical protein